MSTSLRLSPALMKRIAKLAEASALTPHGFMVRAIEEKLEAEEIHQRMVSEAEAHLGRMKKQNDRIPADEVFEYFRRRATGKPARRPKTHRLQ